MATNSPVIDGEADAVDGADRRRARVLLYDVTQRQDGRAGDHATTTVSPSATGPVTCT